MTRTIWRNIPSTPVLFAALAVMWGTSFVAIEVGLDYFPTLTFAAIRYELAGLVMLAYAIYSTDRWRPKTRDELLATAIGAVFIIAAYHGLLYLGEHYIPGAIAAIIISLSPILTAVFASSILSTDSLGKTGMLGLVAGFVGVVLVADPGAGGFDSAQSYGILLVFLGAVAFSLGAVLTRPLRTDLPVQSMQAWTMFVGGVILHVAGLVRGESFAAIEWAPVGIASFLYLTLVSGAVAFLIYFELLDRVGPTELNLIGYLEPVVAAVMSWVLLGHAIDATALVGFVSIFAGFALLKKQVLLGVVATVRRRVAV
ncbi:DMT family transporter [Haloferax larsenii]|uniref:Permease of the drug/metabolite transporter (DMT) superfamily n=1 Tax=Haloferax larsenii TaxID=302484 RepID=A0A1H7NFK3_HALLR|nr:EamA family transporter [Haloferax larsenii]SEL22111.1 Permease of the drug/metabolite transporter (DMT) superfamily [Haloferax larsenii]